MSQRLEEVHPYKDGKAYLKINNQYNLKNFCVKGKTLKTSII